MKIIEKELEAIRNEIVSGFVDPLPSGAIFDFLSNGSKLIRSTLGILYLKSQNITINNEIIKILATGEIIHNSSLLHDDVLDNADTRRGKTVIAKTFSPKISILAGDFLISRAIEKLLELNNFTILTSFKECTKKMAEAEIKQYFLRETIPTEEDYIDICTGKTANLFSKILESCANLTNISTEQAKIFAQNFGICFQIKNDLNKESALIDKNNGIYTAKEILGIEKTLVLLDNYKEEMRKLIENFPENIYKNELKDLINSL